jgi:hypothetical protein
LRTEKKRRVHSARVESSANVRLSGDRPRKRRVSFHGTPLGDGSFPRHPHRANLRQTELKPNPQAQSQPVTQPRDDTGFLGSESTFGALDAILAAISQQERFSSQRGIEFEPVGDLRLLDHRRMETQNAGTLAITENSTGEISVPRRIEKQIG